MSYRKISQIAKCSHGPVHAEVLAVRKEEAATLKAKADALAASATDSLKPQTSENQPMSFPDTSLKVAA